MKYSLRKKGLLMAAISVSVAGTMLSYMFIVATIQRKSPTAASLRAMLLNEKKQALKGHVEMAASVLEKLTTEEAKKTASGMKYAENGHIWVNGYNNVVFVDPVPSLGERGQFDVRDPNGLRIVREITKACREKGEAYVSYVWDGSSKDSPRLPALYYAKAIPSRGWIVGAGISLADVDVALARERGPGGAEVSTGVAQSVAMPLAVLAILLILVFLLLNKFTFGPIRIITGALKNLNNDLTVTIPITTADEVGELSGWLNEHIKKLNYIIGKFFRITDKVNSHAGAIALTMEQQSAFAIQLSSSVVEISSTMEEFSSTARQIAQHSQSVAERADKTLEDSKHGATEVENLTFKINDISENIQANLSEIVELGKKSKEINKIMAIINNIANQTKLIAFNAALEAASAGEEGKRFGVVAVEIRRLADSVVESTSEIEGKITEILDSVNRLVMSSEKSSELIQEGQEYASHTVSMLIESVDGVEETADAARQISLSTQQQQIASGQVVLALKDIEQGVRHATDSIHQSKIVTGELAGLSEQLRMLVSTFKVSDDIAEDGAAQSGEVHC